MSVTFKKKIFREDPSIDFYRSSSEFNEYVRQTYIDTGKISVWRQEEYLDETLQTVEYETIFRDRESLNEALNDPEFKKDAEELTQYCFESLIRLLTVQIDNNLKEIECDPGRLQPLGPADLPS
jgi:hypothetical protein